jgi:hypothetical protein
MGRLPLVDPDDPDADQKAADLLRMMRAATGRDFAVIQAVANHGGVTGSGRVPQRGLRQQQLDPRTA